MFLESRARLVRKADNLTAICEPTIWTMWDSRHFTNLQASTACYDHSLTFYVKVVSMLRVHVYFFCVADITYGYTVTYIKELAAIIIQSRNSSSLKRTHFTTEDGQLGRNM
jgi:hypothetical protein